ncbi:MAG: hypothetical protein WC201_02185 [Bacilli bacterium]
MKKIITLLMCALFAFSCSKPDLPLDYDDFPSLFILWEDVFKQKEAKYYVYFYSNQCYYCQQIKEKLLIIIKHATTPYYLLSYNEAIPIAEDVDQTIGASTIEQLWFGGTPSLLEIEMNAVTKNILGVQKISDFLFY